MNSGAVHAFDFALTWYADPGARAWLSGIPTWSWRAGGTLLEAYGPGRPDVARDACKLLEAAEAVQVLRRGKLCMTTSVRAFAGLGGLTFSGPELGRGLRTVTGPEWLHHATCYAWQLTELGAEFFAWRGE